MPSVSFLKYCGLEVEEEKEEEEDEEEEEEEEEEEMDSKKDMKVKKGERIGRKSPDL